MLRSTRKHLGQHFCCLCRVLLTFLAIVWIVQRLNRDLVIYVSIQVTLSIEETYWLSWRMQCGDAIRQFLFIILFYETIALSVAGIRHSQVLFHSLFVVPARRNISLGWQWENVPSLSWVAQSALSQSERSWRYASTVWIRWGGIESRCFSLSLVLACSAIFECFTVWRSNTSARRIFQFEHSQLVIEKVLKLLQVPSATGALEGNSLDKTDARAPFQRLATS